MTKIRESDGGGYERRGKFYVRVTVGAQDRVSKLAPWATRLPEVQERGRVLRGFPPEEGEQLRLRAHDVRAFFTTAGMFEAATPCGSPTARATRR